MKNDVAQNALLSFQYLSQGNIEQGQVQKMNSIMFLDSNGVVILFPLIAWRVEIGAF